MKSYDASRTINGTFGELSIDDYDLAEVTGLEAKVSFDKQEVTQAGKMGKGYKITGYDGKGTVKFNHVTSYFQTKLSDQIKAGKTPTCTIISKLADPDSFGCERVKLTGVVFDEMTLANWEAKKIDEESVGFTFSDWEMLDVIKNM